MCTNILEESADSIIKVKMEAGDSSEMYILIYQTMWHHSLKDHNFDTSNYDFLSLLRLSYFLFMHRLFHVDENDGFAYLSESIFYLLQRKEVICNFG
jgi:hypothetical protein